MWRSGQADQIPGDPGTWSLGFDELDRVEAIGFGEFDGAVGGRDFGGVIVALNFDRDGVVVVSEAGVDGLGEIDDFEAVTLVGVEDFDAAFHGVHLLNYKLRSG